MGQEPNIELQIQDLPRPVPRPDPARRWSPTRPGELGSPDDVPWGGRYGTPGPDTGYVLKLLAGRELALADGERRADVEAALVALAAGRASHFGRAPIGADLDVAGILLGLDTEGIPAEHVAALNAARPGLVAGLAHHPHHGGGLVAAVPREVLAMRPAQVRERVAAEGPFVHL